MKALSNSKLLRSPYLEIALMVSSVVLSYFGLLILGAVPQQTADGMMSTLSIVWIQLAFFLLSVAIALISVIAGIGGGVIFTPIMLAFTGINSVVVRGTGLIVAMFSGLISTGIFIRKGLANYRMCLILTLCQGFGALAGAALAIKAAAGAGALGEGLMRAGLGLILIAIAVYFLVGGKKLEFPEVGRVDRFTSSLRLDSSYYEESEGSIRAYKVKKAGLGMALIFLVGLIGGFFGMGGGWAITPVLNMGMGIPLKLAAANSGVILGVGSCVSIWPYIYAGGIIPLFVLPWLAGQVIGGFVGSYVLAKIKVGTVRLILIGIMFFTSFGLVTKGLAVMGVMNNPPAIVQVIVFSVIIAGVIAAIVMQQRKRSAEPRTGEQQAAAESITKTEYTAPIPRSMTVYASIVHWITIIASIAALFIPILILINPQNNVLNPNGIFGAIFSGATPAEIWSMSETGSFPGAHYYLTMLSRSDSWAQLAINLGCSVGLWAIVPASFLQLFKEKDRLYGALGLVLALLIALSMTGIIG